MESLERLSARRQTMEGLGSIFRTMKTLSAVLVKQVEARQAELAEFETANRLSLTALLHDRPAVTPTPALTDGCLGWFVFGAERGFCGRFNERILSFMADEARLETGIAEMMPIGTRLSEKMIEEGMSVEAMAQLPATPQGLEPLLQTLLQKVRVWQEDGVAQITALYTQRSESGALLPVKQVLWPIPFETLERAQQSEWPTNKSPLVFANRVETMTLVLRQLLKSGLVNACMNSMLSESSARLANLQVAEDNINQHLEELQQKHNTLRQSTITAELQDITAAFDMISSRA